jgi:hypothetical protein
MTKKISNRNRNRYKLTRTLANHTVNLGSTAICLWSLEKELSLDSWAWLGATQLISVLFRLVADSNHVFLGISRPMGCLSQSMCPRTFSRKPRRHHPSFWSMAPWAWCKSAYHTDFPSIWLVFSALAGCQRVGFRPFSRNISGTSATQMLMPWLYRVHSRDGIFFRTSTHRLHATSTSLFHDFLLSRCLLPCRYAQNEDSWLRPSGSQRRPRCFK